MADRETLSTRFNKAGKSIHNLSDSLVNAKLVALLTDRQLYARALSRFYYVFASLEQALDEALKNGDKDVETFKSLFKEGSIYRTAAFRADLENLLGANWEVACSSKSIPLKEYEHHLALLASTQPRLLLAHSYTQHLAIAAGGQAVRRIVRKHLALPEGVCTTAFEFKGESSNTLKTKFKSVFDEWGRGLSEEAVQELTAEHLTAFQYNNAIIRTFPIPSSAVVKGVLCITPRPVVLVALALVALLVALIIPWLAHGLRQATTRAI
ncbi:hypothetical protein Vretimale_1883 [Volvox reticuliferus]|nr:hypothetical protein Vretimale_1883 [Volvox reticuliferus]